MEVSVIIPTLNEEKNIKNLLNSLKKQTYKGKYEIIVADGNSEDKTREIAKKYTNKVLIEKIRNAAAERQAGAKSAEGKILLFVDADSIADENWIQEIVNCFEHKDVVSAGGKIGPLEEDTLIQVGSKFWSLAVYASLLVRLPLVVGSNLAIKKEVFDKIGGFETNKISGEDTTLIRSASKYGKYKYNPKAKVYVSIRRIKRMGRINYLFFHIKNHFNTYLFNKPSINYEPIR
ncbi:glycosyltransferase [Candidatus Micrarchaeota archaeon]|nr:glycosyltransferase [Candidatus Micrarchaeota archaeon]